MPPPKQKSWLRRCSSVLSFPAPSFLRVWCSSLRITCPYRFDLLSYTFFAISRTVGVPLFFHFISCPASQLRTAIGALLFFHSLCTLWVTSASSSPSSSNVDPMNVNVFTLFTLSPCKRIYGSFCPPCYRQYESGLRCRGRGG